MRKTIIQYRYSRRSSECARPDSPPYECFLLLGEPDRRARIAMPRIGGWLTRLLLIHASNPWDSLEAQHQAGR
jgi:hypothetical protein